MKKKFLLATMIAAALSAAVFNVCFADEVKYNYKFNMDAESEFSMLYGYTGGHDADSGLDPVQPQPSKAFISGKYGKALSITYYGWKLPGHKMYNAFCLIMPTDPVKVGEETKPLIDILKDTQQISFWVRTPVTVDHGEGAVANRLIDMSVNITDSEGKSTGYTARLTLPNTGDWSYMTVPMSSFVNGNTKLSDAVLADNITAFQQINFVFPRGGRDYFGAEPTNLTLEESWQEPLDIDELLLDCSKEGVIAVTPASSGEETYVTNANIKNVLVDGRVVSGFDKNASSNTIPVPAYCTPENLAEHISAEVEAPTLTASAQQQPVSGATYVVNPPSQIPGTGSITIVSGDRKSRKTYNLNFTKRTPFQINVQDITGINEDGSLPVGNANITVPVMNEGNEGTLSAAAVLVLKDKFTSEAKGAAYIESKDIAPETTEQYSFSLDIPENAYAEVYFFDSLDTMNLKTEPITIPYSDITYKATTGNLLDSSAAFNEESGTVTVSGTVSGGESGSNVMIALTDSSDNLVDLLSAKITDSVFSKDIKIRDDITGNLSLYIYANGKKTQKTVYKPSQTEIDNCLRDFASASGDYTGYFNKYSMVLNIPEELIAMMSDAEKTEAIKSAAGVYTSFAQLKQAVNEGTVLSILNRYNDLETAKLIYSNYNNYAGFDNTTDYFKEYITSQSSIDNILTRLVKDDHNTIEELREDFNDLALAESFNNVSSYAQVGLLINGNTERISPYFDYAKFNSLTSSQKTEYYKQVVSSSTITELGDLDTILTKYINNLNSGGGGGGGGGGSSSSGSSDSGKGTGGGFGVASPQTTPGTDEQPTVTVTHRTTFSDLQEGHWAYNSVASLESLGIISGREDGSFGTNDPITREEFVKLLIGVFETDITEGGECPFEDVPSDSWYAPYVIAANTSGVVNGISDTKFGVGENITRQDMSVMIVRMLQNSGIVVESSIDSEFDDDDEIAEYAKKSIYGLKNAGLINGKGDNLFMPLDNATRAEAAMLLYSVYGYINQ